MFDLLNVPACPYCLVEELLPIVQKISRDLQSIVKLDPQLISLGDFDGGTP